MQALPGSLREAALRCGDFVFSPFTDFTIFTKFTRPTLFTPFTKFTFRTPFTFFTPFTTFTLGPFTRFTPFTRPFTIGPGPDPGPFVQPFVRFGNSVFAPEELELARFEAFGDVAEPFAAVGLGRLDVLACSDAGELAGALSVAPEEVAPLIESAQQHLRALAGAA